MDTATRNLSRYVKEKGINVTKMAKACDIPYFCLYDSLLAPEQRRNLRASEFLAVCHFLELDPMKFKDEIEPANEQDKTE